MLQEWLDLYNAMVVEQMILEEIASELYLLGIITPPISRHQGALISKLVEIIREERTTNESTTTTKP